MGDGTDVLLLHNQGNRPRQTELTTLAVSFAARANQQMLVLAGSGGGDYCAGRARRYRGGAATADGGLDATELVIEGRAQDRSHNVRLNGGDGHHVVFGRTVWWATGADVGGGRATLDGQ